MRYRAVSYTHLDVYKRQLINVSADEALGCTEPAEFKQAFAALIASITSNLRNDEQRARFVATVESTSGQIPAITESAQAQYDETCAIFATCLLYTSRWV